MLTTLFLLLGFHVESGRLYVIHNDRIIVVSNHRSIHERITADVELVEIIQIVRRGKDASDNPIVDYPYNPKTFGHSNRDYLATLKRRLADHEIVMARIYYLGGRLVMVEVREHDR
jgi:hypothetical protein